MTKHGTATDSADPGHLLHLKLQHGEKESEQRSKHKDREEMCLKQLLQFLSGQHRLMEAMLRGAFISPAIQ